MGEGLGRRHNNSMDIIMSDYEKKIERAIKLLRAIPQDCELEIGYSAGKDSDVILQLAKESGVPHKAVHKNTTIDTPGTLAHAKKNGAVILQPKKRFFDLMPYYGVPSRFYRFCCRYLKEYRTGERVVLGIRKSESSRRKNRYNEPEECKVYRKDMGGGKAKLYYPILDWTNDDIVRFIKERGIQCHPQYYDEWGEFHVERRVGCLACPLKTSRQMREDFLKYPKLLRLWVKNAQIHIDTHPESGNALKFNHDASELMLFKLFYEGKNYDKFKKAISGGIFGGEIGSAKQYLEDYFGVDL